MALIDVEVLMDGGGQDGLLVIHVWEQSPLRRIAFPWTYLEISPGFQPCPHCRGEGCTACCGTGRD